MDWNKIASTVQLNRIQWKFNPPSAAWWGGFWERMVRTMKELLRRTLGKSTLTYDKLHTLICEVEGVINRRPLTALSDSADDLSPLTPSLFLDEMPCPDYNEFLDASGFQAINKKRKSLLEQIKMRFRKEYLAMLVQRQKEKKTVEVAVGDVVLVGSDNQKRWEWPMARILELIPGKDGEVRVAKVKTAHGILFRPLQRLFPMEVTTAEPILKMEPKTPIREDGQVSQPSSSPEVFITRFGRQVKVPDRF